MSYIQDREGDSVDLSPAIVQLRAEKRRRELGASNIPVPRTLDKEEWPPDYDLVRAWRQQQLERIELDKSLLNGPKGLKAYYRTRPEQFINHWCSTYDPRRAAQSDAVWIPLILFRRQAQMVQFCTELISAEASGLIEKSRTMGATWTALGISAWLWLFWENSAVGWGSQDQNSVDRIGDTKSVFEKLRRLIRGLPPVLLPEGFVDDKHLTHMRCLNPETGASVVGEVGDNIGRGGRTLTYFVDESAHLAHPEQVEASLLETTRTRVDISSVSGLNTVFYRKRQAGLEWEPGNKVDPSRTNVFIMDWSDHPEKTKDWHQERRAKAVSEGLTHVFAREVDRDYAGAVEGIIIPNEWVRASLDAHVKLGFSIEGPYTAALDVADGGKDRNAFAKRKSVVLIKLGEWGERDTGVTARRAIGLCQDTLPIDLQYDCIGVGSGIKAETNRLRDDGHLPKGIQLVPWSASARVLHPIERVVPNDRDSPTNKEFYYRFKDQAWWEIRRKFERTYRAITEVDFTWDLEDLISISTKDIDPGLLRKLIKELSQPTITHNSKMQLMVDKIAEGTTSPNLGDAFVMCYWPWEGPMQARISISGPIIIEG